MRFPPGGGGRPGSRARVVQAAIVDEGAARVTVAPLPRSERVSPVRVELRGAPGPQFLVREHCAVAEDVALELERKDAAVARGGGASVDGLPAVREGIFLVLLRELSLAEAGKEDGSE